MKRQKTGMFLLFVPLLLLLLIMPIVYARDISGSPSLSTTEWSSQASWTLVNASPGWLGRVNHASVMLPGGDLILIGGYHAPDDYFNDVWRSSDNGATWTRLVEHAGWTGRFGHRCVVAADGSLILTGGVGYAYGSSHSEFKNDVWKSADGGKTWTRIVEHAPWANRSYFNQVVMQDGSIILLGGVRDDSVYLNDVWQTTDNGAIWTRMTANAGWSARVQSSSVVMPDGSIVLMGGDRNNIHYNDVWRSTDNGATWTRMTANAGWSPRFGHTSVVLPDGSIVLCGGETSSGTTNDMWRSTDNGATWTQVNTNASWSPRFYHASVAMPDGSIVLMGGTTRNDYNGVISNDVWQFVPAGSTLKKSSDGILVTKTIKPISLKQGTDARITITVFNRGATPVHDVEILDTALPEFPVIDGITKYSVPSIDSNDTRILTYTVRATQPGSFRFNKTAVMYADQAGNYHITYSDYQKVEVLAPLFSPTPQKGGDGFIRNLIAWFNRLGFDT